MLIWFQKICDESLYIMDVWCCVCVWITHYEDERERGIKNMSKE